MTVTAPASFNLQEALKSFNLTEGEYHKILNHLGRDPNFTELAMFSAMWSEHCCYKHSKHLLRKLPTQGPRIVQGPGENAGIVDVGDDLHIAFKIESHNHPTAVEPYQGAATGVGGILRDIITMNARPIALLNALRFGPFSTKKEEKTPESTLPQGYPEEASLAKRNRYLFWNAVKGIGDYGNCVGVPTVAGDVFFDQSFSRNPLVNAMAVGMMKADTLMSAKAIGVGNPVLYVGSPTGRDGTGGAAFASRALDDSKKAADRPAVQVGDPFSEKLLLEACLEVFNTGCVASGQDMGAAGLTSSTCEMAAKGGLGMRLDLDKVPVREPGMQPFEYMLSESQERMVLILEKGKEQPVYDVLDKWHLPYAIVGEVIAEDRILVDYQGERVVDLPATLLTDLAPEYAPSIRPTEPEAMKTERTRNAAEGIAALSFQNLESVVKALLSSPNIAQPVGVYSQYDRHVRNATLLSSENHSSGVIRLRHPDGHFTQKALAMTVDGNPRYVGLEPYAGSLTAVTEAARNLVSVGAEPLAVTDNLNFGDPEDETTYYHLYYSVEGIKDACEALKTPVTGGNVSLYNTKAGIAILPNPVIGMVGLVHNHEKTMSPWFKAVGDTVALLGRFKPTLGGSEYQRVQTNTSFGSPPTVSLNDETFLNRFVRQALIERQHVQSVNDVSTGGLLITLLEGLFSRRFKQAASAETLGLKMDLSSLTNSELRLDELLFGETNGSFVISYSASQQSAVKQAFFEEATTMQTLGLQSALTEIGTVIAQPELQLTVNGQTVSLTLEPLYQCWSQVLI